MARYNNGRDVFVNNSRTPFSSPIHPTYTFTPSFLYSCCISDTAAGTFILVSYIGLALAVKYCCRIPKLNLLGGLSTSERKEFLSFGLNPFHSETRPASAIILYKIKIR